MLRGVGMYLLPAAAVSMLTLAAFHVAKQQKPLTSLEPVQAPAQTAFDETVAATGIAEAQSENIVVGSALAGVIEEVYVPSSQVGTRVDAGTPLFRVDDRHLRAQLAVAEARRASAAAQLKKLDQLPRPEELPPAEARVRSAKAAADQARDDYRRAEQLYRRNVVTEQESVSNTH